MRHLAARSWALIAAVALAPAVFGGAGPDATKDVPAWLGILFGSAPDGGAQVVAVVPGGPAARGGVREGDVVVGLGGRDVMDRRALEGAVAALRPGEAIEVRLIRGGRTETIRIVPAVRDDASWMGGIPSLPRSPADTYDPPRAPRPGLGSKEGDRLGVEVASIPAELRLHLGAPADAGVLVIRLGRGGSGERAGVRVGDVLLRAREATLENGADLDAAIARAGGAAMVVQAIRGRRPITIALPAAAPSGPTERERLEAERERLRREIERVERALGALEERR